MIHENILSTIGSTPLVRINSFPEKNMLVKLEKQNPGGSIKDRPALNIIREAEKRGDIQPGDTIVEPTSGNTGIGIALVASVKGYKAIFIMPQTMSIERQKILKAYGATIILTDGKKGMKGAIEEAEKLSKKHNYFMPQQFENRDNPLAHKITAEEIWNDTNGQIDVLVCAIGTGGTITGTGTALKEKKKDIIIVGIEPKNSAVLSGKSAGSHKIQGTGAGFVPKILQSEILDKIVQVSDEDAYMYTKILSQKEGILSGISSGAVLYAMHHIAQNPKYAGKTIVGILPDTGERYLSSDVF